jgi:hypothetical protein
LDRTAKLWSSDSGECSNTLLSDRTAKLWSSDSGECLKTMAPKSIPVDGIRGLKKFWYFCKTLARLRSSRFFMKYKKAMKVMKAKKALAYSIEIARRDLRTWDDVLDNWQRDTLVGMIARADFALNQKAILGIPVNYDEERETLETELKPLIELVGYLSCCTGQFVRPERFRLPRSSGVATPASD